jgi:hypothetical protein
MNPAHGALGFAIGLFVGMLVLLEVGRRIGVRRLTADFEGSRAGVGTVDAAIFALFGLLTAFTFSGAATRFDARRHLIVQEANAIGTAYLRLDLLPAEAQPAMRDRFRRYVDLRLEFYKSLPDDQAAAAAQARVIVLQSEIWREAVAAGRGAGPTLVLLLPALNEMIDITTTRAGAAMTHPPLVIFAMLGLLALVSALLAGYDMASGKTRNLLHILGFAAIVSVTVYVILDLEYPRSGYIRVDAFDQLLVDVRKHMN